MVVLSRIWRMKFTRGMDKLFSLLIETKFKAFIILLL